MAGGESGAPDLRKAGRIRDPIHGYAFFTGIERVILDHPLAQRLRHVAQSGMAQMVFLDVRSSRFSHSLGPPGQRSPSPTAAPSPAASPAAAGSAIAK